MYYKKLTKQVFTSPPNLKAMKKLMLLCLSLLMVSAFSCASKKIPTTAQVNFVRQNLPGTVTLQAIGYGKDKTEAEITAFKTAIGTIAYQGLPGFAPLQRAWFDDRSTENSTYWTSFYADRKYLAFITDQQEAQTFKQPKGAAKLAKTAIQKEFTLNYQALHKKLTEDGLLRQQFSY